MGSHMTYQEFIATLLPQLAQGAGITLAIACLAALGGAIGGTILGIAQTSKESWLRAAVTLYVTIIRGTPMLLQIMFLFLTLPSTYFSPFAVATIALAINSSAYVSQIIRSGITSVPKGQLEAARTLGISNFDLTRYILLPQALRVVIPALGNEFITLIKDSSLAALIGVLELYNRGQIIISQTHDSFPVYITTGLLYLIMTTIVSIIIHKTEITLNRYVRN
jgi:His/Glu/Gln/Arg/opine family amino acid ABC transporter permease subunit